MAWGKVGPPSASGRCRSLLLCRRARCLLSWSCQQVAAPPWLLLMEGLANDASGRKRRFRGLSGDRIRMRPRRRGPTSSPSLMMRRPASPRQGSGEADDLSSRLFHLAQQLNQGRPQPAWAPQPPPAAQTPWPRAPQQWCPPPPPPQLPPLPVMPSTAGLSPEWTTWCQQVTLSIRYLTEISLQLREEWHRVTAPMAAAPMAVALSRAAPRAAPRAALRPVRPMTPFNSRRPSAAVALVEEPELVEDEEARLSGEEGLLDQETMKQEGSPPPPGYGRGRRARRRRAVLGITAGAASSFGD